MFMCSVERGVARWRCLSEARAITAALSTGRDYRRCCVFVCLFNFHTRNQYNGGYPEAQAKFRQLMASSLSFFIY